MIVGQLRVVVDLLRRGDPDLLEPAGDELGGLRARSRRRERTRTELQRLAAVRHLADAVAVGVLVAGVLEDLLGLRRGRSRSAGPRGSPAIHSGSGDTLSVSAGVPSPRAPRSTIVFLSIAWAIAWRTSRSSSAGCGFFEAAPAVDRDLGSRPGCPGRRDVGSFSSWSNACRGTSSAASISPLFERGDHRVAGCRTCAARRGRPPACPP